MMLMNLSDIGIIKIKNVSYCYIITGISKSEAINLMQNIDLGKKKVKNYEKEIENYHLNKDKYFENIYKKGKNSYKIY